MQAGGLDGRLPVFVFPPALTFYIDDLSTHKQILTLYNPYDFPLTYKVFCNAPSRYNADSPNGVVKTKCQVDIIVRHLDPSISFLQSPDKFRIQVSEEGGRKVLGKKDVSTSLVRGKPELSTNVDNERFESLSAVFPSTTGTRGGRSPGQYPVQQAFGNIQNNGPSLVLVTAAVVCLLTMLLPTEGDKSPTRIPHYLHINSNVKIVVAYVLGLLTYAILRAG